VRQVDGALRQTLGFQGCISVPRYIDLQQGSHTECRLGAWHGPCATCTSVWQQPVAPKLSRKPKAPQPELRRCLTALSYTRSAALSMRPHAFAVSVRRARL
jgi:hypothetical protein